MFASPSCCHMLLKGLIRVFVKLPITIHHNDLTDYTPLILCAHARARRKGGAGFRNRVRTRGSSCSRCPGEKTVELLYTQLSVTMKKSPLQLQQRCEGKFLRNICVRK